MARSSPRKLGADLKSLSSMGNRPTSAMGVATTLLYAMTVLFALIFIVTVGTEDVDADVDGMKTNAFTYICVVAASALVLFVLEFYPSLNSLMKLFRLGVMALLLIFVCLAINPVLNLADAGGSAGDRTDGIVYAFACLTITFAGLSALLNILEVFRNSGY